MEIPRPTEADRARFAALVPDDPRVTTKPMFGNVAASVNGNMFMGLLGSSIGLRLAQADLAAVRALPGSGPFGPGGRPMGAYLALPADLRTAMASGLAWRALEHVAALPPKKSPSART